MVDMPLPLDMEVRQVDMEGMHPLLDMVGMFLLLDMELGRRGMIIGDKRQAVRPPSSEGRLSAKEVVGTARRQFIISSRYHHASVHSKVGVEPP
jgi:hypothetical protein